MADDVAIKLLDELCERDTDLSSAVKQSSAYLQETLNFIDSLLKDIPEQWRPIGLVNLRNDFEEKATKVKRLAEDAYRPIDLTPLYAAIRDNGDKPSQPAKLVPVQSYRPVPQPIIKPTGRVRSVPKGGLSDILRNYLAEHAINQPVPYSQIVEALVAKGFNKTSIWATLSIWKNRRTITGERGFAQYVKSARVGTVPEPASLAPSDNTSGPHNILNDPYWQEKFSRGDSEGGILGTHVPELLDQYPEFDDYLRGFIDKPANAKFAVYTVQEMNRVLRIVRETYKGKIPTGVYKGFLTLLKQNDPGYLTGFLRGTRSATAEAQSRILIELADRGETVVKSTLRYYGLY